MERAAVRGGQIGGDRRDDAAGGAGDDEHRVGSQNGFLRVGERPVGQAHTPAPAVGVADLHATGIAQRLVDQHVGQRRRLPADGEVDGLDERVGALPLVRLGEPGDRAAQRARRPGRVVAVVAAEAGGHHQERAALVAPPHGQVQVAYAPAQCVPPAGEVHVLEAALVVERRQPVHAVDFSVGERGVDVVVGVHFDHVNAEPGQPGAQRVADTAVVAHHRDPGAGGQGDPGRRARREAGAQRGHRDPAPDAVGGREVAFDRVL